VVIKGWRAARMRSSRWQKPAGQPAECQRCIKECWYASITCLDQGQGSAVLSTVQHFLLHIHLSATHNVNN